MLLFQILELVLFVSSVNLAKPRLRVVNGTNTSIQRYPFMVSLRFTSGNHFCGGAIISDFHVLTAAHCTHNIKANEMVIQYGVTKIDTSGHNVVKVKKTIQHEEYKYADSAPDDIAVVEVESPFPIDNKTVSFVGLPWQNFETPQTPQGSPGVLLGWGLNATRGTIMTHLKAVDLKIYSNHGCVALLKKGDVNQNQLCAGVDAGGKGQCTGDSGGPLVYKNGNKLLQVGIVSWSYKPCASPHHPGVFTKVSKYFNWIKGKISGIK